MSKREQRRVAVLAVAIRYACSRKSGSASLAQPGCRLDPGLCKLSAYRKAQRTVNKQEASERNACIMEMATGDSQLGKNYSPHVHAFPVNMQNQLKRGFSISTYHYIWLQKIFKWREVKIILFLLHTIL